MLDSFWSWVETEEVLSVEKVEELKASEQDVEDVSLGIRVEVLNAALGLEDGFRVALETDEQYQAALEHLPEARDFWLAWQTANQD